MTVAVLGSANVDTVVRMPRLPLPGETVLGIDLAGYPGGKGLNQAVAAARAGARAVLLAAVGRDDGARIVAEALAEARVENRLRQTGLPTGSAMILVAEDGQNSIVVVPSANGRMTRLRSDEEACVAGSDLLLLQMEVPLEVLVEAAAVARGAGRLVILNAAPVRELPPALVRSLDVLVVNETEAAFLLKDDPSVFETEAGAEAAIGRLRAGLDGFSGSVLVTLGARGALVLDHDGSGVVRVPARAVLARDTTAAGDTFCGALAAQLDRGEDLIAATRFAVAAGSLAVQKPGAVPSIPDEAAIRAFLDEPTPVAET